MSALFQALAKDSATGALLVTTGTAAPDHYYSGLPFESDGTLCVDTSGAITHYHQGIPFTAEGRISVTTDAVSYYGSGAAPFSSAGRLAMTADAASSHSSGVAYSASGSITALGLSALVWAAAGSQHLFTGSGSHELKAQYLGVGTPSFTTSALLLPDNNGVYVSISANTATWHGARWAGGIPYDDDGTGTTLSPYPKLYGAPALTNDLTYSNDLTNAVWTMRGTATATLDEVGITGEPNTACAVVVGTGGNDIFQRVTGTVSDAVSTPRIFMKAVSSGTLLIQNPAGSSRGKWYVDLSLVSTTDFEAVTSDHAAVTVSSAFSNNGTASGVHFKSNSGIQTIIVGNSEYHDDKSISEVRGSAPIITVGSAVTTSAVAIAYDIGNHDDDKGAYYCEYRNFGAESVGIITAGNAARVLYSNLSSRIGSYDGAGAVTVFGSTITGSDISVGVAYSLTDSLFELNWEGSKAEGAFVGYTAGTSLYVASDIAGGGSPDAPVLIGDVRRYDLDYADAKAKLVELIALSALLLNMPLQVSITPTKGTGAPTYARAGEATFQDFEGLIKTVLEDEARFEGSRRVANLIADSYSFSGWSGIGTGVITDEGDGTAVVSGLDGAGGNFATEDTLLGVSISGQTARFSISILGAGTDIGKTVALTLKRASGGADSPQSATLTLTGAWQRVTIPLHSGNASNTGYVVQVGGSTGSGTPAGGVTIKAPQIEQVTGQANQNPSEYVSVGVLSDPWHGAGVDGVKNFLTKNGNTVASNVVTEATGAVIDGDDFRADAGGPFGYLSESASENRILNSDAFEEGSWNAQRVTITDNDHIGPSGKKNAALIVDSTDNHNHRWWATPTTETGEQAFSVYAKKYVGLDWCWMRLNNASGNPLLAYFNVTTGDTGLVDSGLVSSMELGPNGWYRCSIVEATGFVGSAVAMMGLASADGVPNYAGNGTDGMYFASAQEEESSFPTSYIPTEASAVSRNADVLTIPDTGNIEDAAGTAVGEFSTLWSTIGGQAHGLSRNSNGRFVYISGGVPDLSVTYDGANLSFTDRTTSMFGVVEEARSSWGDELTAYYKGVPDSTPYPTYSGTMGSGDIAIGCRNDGAVQWNGTIRNVKIYNVEDI